MIVPSACETKKSVAEEGTQWTAVQGEFVMQPFLYSSVTEWFLQYENQVIPACSVSHNEKTSDLYILRKMLRMP